MKPNSDTKKSKTKKNKLREDNMSELGRFLSRYGVVALTGARLLYDVLVRNDVLH